MLLIFVVAAADIGPVRGVIVANAVKLAWVVAVTTVVLTTRLVMIVGLALLSPMVAVEKDGMAIVEAIAFMPIIVCGRPGGSEKVPFPVPQLHLSSATSGSQHHVSWPHETKDPLLASTGLPKGLSATSPEDDLHR